MWQMNGEVNKDHAVRRCGFGLPRNAYLLMEQMLPSKGASLPSHHIILISTNTSRTPSA